ncbi:MAG: class I SAM-dependent methyltransferase [Bdellovibrionales bacterium]|nr:class I SAM-dependent methyltransferase [Bdellovibrionales bacterium]
MIPSTKRDGEPIQHVSDTSFWIAAYRAMESERPDALFRDPLAKVLSDGRGEAIAREMGGGNRMSWVVALRTVVIDDFIRDGIRKGVDTVLNLGAGLDTRPYRLDLPESLRWIEVDFPHVISYKTLRLGGEPPKCDLERISLDLADADARERLLANIGAKSARVLVLTEGVVPYLPNEAVADLATDLYAQRSFKYWVTDYFSKTVMKYRKRQKMFRKLDAHAPFRFSPGDWEKFFADAGWGVSEMRYIFEEGVRRGRPPPAPAWPFRLLYQLMPAEKRAEIARMMGYALLERRIAAG